MNIDIRPMEKQDYDAIYEMLKNELGYIDTNYSNFIDKLNEIELHNDYNTFVAIINGEAVGFIGIHEGMAFNSDYNFYSIIALAVNSQYQGKGIGTRLINHIEQIAKNNGIKGIALSSGLQRAQAHRFYINNGYENKGLSFKKYL